MGAWGHEPFENDSALDWVAEVEGLDGVRATLRQCEEEDDYLEGDEGSAAVAAAALIAAALDGDVGDLSDSGLEPLQGATVTAEDAALAMRALTRVMTGSSELPDLWGAGSDWHVQTEQLIQRLGRLSAP